MAASDDSFWAESCDEKGRRRTEDYAILGDSETAALVSRTGSIDWLCWPRFDSEASLAALLGGPENGFWRIAPKGSKRNSNWRYRGDTLILESVFETDEGSVLIIDLMPLRKKAADLVRVVVGRSGCVDMRSVLDLRFEYGKLRPLLRRQDEKEVAAVAGPHAVVLRSSHGLDVRGSAICADFSLAEGERATFVLTYYASHLDPPEPVDPDAAVAETERFWRDWVGRCSYEGPYRDKVVRSLITLKALTYRPTGGTVAAPTTSIPETLRGGRTWDYRYCWLRDAAFMLLAFIHAGYEEEAAAWRDWLLRAAAGEPGELKPLYALDGDQGLHEWQADWLRGFNGVGPVRIGNAAHHQRQIDVFGEIMDAFHLARKHGLEPHQESLSLQRRLLEALEQCWSKPDAGIWEFRTEPRHFVHSKALAWAAFDRGVRSFRAQGDSSDLDRWSDLRDRIRREVLEKGFDKDRNSFVQAYGASNLDASTLLLPIIGFIEPNDPRALGTVEAIERRLVDRGFVRRYDPEAAEDGLTGEEGAFLPCSFWLVDNYLLQGRKDEAHELFERLIATSNDLGLMSEEYDPGARAMLGNFPQAWSHVALVDSAANLSERKGPAEDRLSLHD